MGLPSRPDSQEAQPLAGYSKLQVRVKGTCLAATQCGHTAGGMTAEAAWRGSGKLDTAPLPLQVSEHLTQGTTTPSTRTHMPCSPGATPGASFASSQAGQVAVHPRPQLGDVCVHAWPAVASLVEQHVAVIANCAQGSMQRIRDWSKRE